MSRVKVTTSDYTGNEIENGFDGTASNEMENCKTIDKERLWRETDRSLDFSQMTNERLQLAVNEMVEKRRSESTDW